MVKRDEKGRFVKGTVANPNGRPPRATEQEYIDAVKDIVPLDRFKRMLERQAQRAEHGDIRAFECVVRMIGIEGVKKIAVTSGGNKIVVSLTGEAVD